MSGIESTGGGFVHAGERLFRSVHVSVTRDDAPLLRGQNLKMSTAGCTNHPLQRRHGHENSEH